MTVSDIAMAPRGFSHHSFSLSEISNISTGMGAFPLQLRAPSQLQPRSQLRCFRPHFMSHSGKVYPIIVISSTVILILRSTNEIIIIIPWMKMIIFLMPPNKLPSFPFFCYFPLSLLFSRSSSPFPPFFPHQLFIIIIRTDPIPVIVKPAIFQIIIFICRRA